MVLVVLGDWEGGELEELEDEELVVCVGEMGTFLFFSDWWFYDWWVGDEVLEELVLVVGLREEFL